MSPNIFLDDYKSAAEDGSLRPFGNVLLGYYYVFDLNIAE